MKNSQRWRTKDSKNMKISDFLDFCTSISTLQLLLVSFSIIKQESSFILIYLYSIHLVFFFFSNQILNFQFCLNDNLFYFFSLLCCYKTLFHMEKLQKIVTYFALVTDIGYILYYLPIILFVFLLFTHTSNVFCIFLLLIQTYLYFACIYLYGQCILF